MKLLFDENLSPKLPRLRETLFPVAVKAHSAGSAGILPVLAGILPASTERRVASHRLVTHMHTHSPAVQNHRFAQRKFPEFGMAAQPSLPKSAFPLR